MEGEGRGGVSAVREGRIRPRTQGGFSTELRNCHKEQGGSAEGCSLDNDSLGDGMDISINSLIGNIGS